MENINREVLQEAKKRGLDAQYLMTYYNCAIREVETKFRVLDEEFSLMNDRNPINSIKTRLKSVPSIVEKLERKGWEVSLYSIENKLNDIAGVRVICSFVQDVYKLADALLAQDDVTLIAYKDYIKNPKENGYRSLHLIVEVPIFLEKEKRKMKVEIQLRTIAMDCWASLEHQLRTIAMDCWASLEHQLRYKKGKNLSEMTEQELLTCASLSTELDERMDDLRKEENI